MENFIIVFLGNDIDGNRVVRAYPYWECEDAEQAIVAKCVDFANEFGTGDFTVQIKSINT